MTEIVLDSFDIAMLAALQRDGALTAAALSEIINLSPSQCARRRAALEGAGIIRGYSVRLDVEALGLGLRALVRVTLRRAEVGCDDEFMRFANGLAPVESAFSVSGEADYVLDVRCRDLADFGTFVHECLLANPHVAQVRSDVVLRTLKDRGVLDLRPDRR